MHNTILIPIDIPHAEIGNKLIDLAVLNAEADARIVLLNVVEEIPAWVAAEMPGDIAVKSRQASLDKLQEIAKAAGRKVEVEVKTGHSSRTILEVAEKMNADLIIVASHKPGLSNYFLGSTASKIVAHAKCSVYVER